MLTPKFDVLVAIVTVGLLVAVAAAIVALRT